MKDKIQEIYKVDNVKYPEDLPIAAAKKLENNIMALFKSVDSFEKSTCLNAKAVAIDIMKKVSKLKNMVLTEEKPILSLFNILLGSSFRKFCEFYEKQDAKNIIQRAPDIKEQSRKCLSHTGTLEDSTIWHYTIKKTANFIIKIVDEAIDKSQEETTPILKFIENEFKLDLNRINIEENLYICLANQGEGVALNVRIKPNLSNYPIEFNTNMIGFEVAGNSTQRLNIKIRLLKPCRELEIPIKLLYSTLDNRHLVADDKIIIKQQIFNPDWTKLLSTKPYSLNPIKEKNKLFGRDTILKTLHLYAHSGTSIFLWGQKRVGKTSVLQVLASELTKIDNFVCIVLRMGEIGSLHEGQIAYIIAKRIAEEINIILPNESDFGANINRLVPFMEKAVNYFPNKKFIVIIDEFDDLNPAFYMGERGKIFIKAIRSLSEIGLTFFFVGSERMGKIYHQHESDLNKWIDYYLDQIETIEDCKSLIIKPVEKEIEYHKNCVNDIHHYCGRNPFYIHLLCSAIFKKCYLDQRTYIGVNDLENIKEDLIRTIGPTNFAHFWEDNPVLTLEEKEQQSGENCLVLSCIAQLGGEYETIEDLINIQDSLGLPLTQRLTNKEFSRVIDNLRRRKIITNQKEKNYIGLPIFREWLNLHAELDILPKWKEFCEKKKDEIISKPEQIIIPESLFPISEDDLLDVAQRLYYCGKQKDVAEIRIWLRQFDEDIRIILAFSLLKRLSEKGFITQGDIINQLSIIQESLQHKRNKTGSKTWKIVRDQKYNLCISYVDRETKSGSSIARELQKRLRPGKCSAASNIINWMSTHQKDDPLVLIVDDFAGTGTSLTKGLNKFFEDSKHDNDLLDWYLKEKRILCYLLYSFPEAIEKLRSEFPEVDILATTVFEDDLRAFHEDSKIFKDNSELIVAKDFLLTMGRDLYKQFPLGYGDIGALVAFHNSIPNNTLPIFWSSGEVNGKPWRALFPRA